MNSSRAPRLDGVAYLPECFRIGLFPAGRIHRFRASLHWRQAPQEKRW